MTIREHVDSFEAVYSRLGDLRLREVRFPLEDIESFRWNRGRWNDAYYDYHYRRFTSHLMSRLELADGMSVLVVGCGFGLDEKNIHTLFPSCDLWSIDVSHNMVNLARAGGSPSSFALALAEQLPFPDASFDRVLSREVIEHVMDPAAMLGEIRRVLKPGGVAVVTTENEESFGPTNFYDSTFWPALAAAADIAVPALPYKDDAPTLGEMQELSRRTGLQLREHFYDGAVYKYLIELAPLLRSRMPDVAHYLSCLENGRKTAPVFCDQVKYVLVKPQGASLKIESPRFACIRCRGPLSERNGSLNCDLCGQQFPVADGVPDFRGRSSQAADESPQAHTKERSMGKRLFHRAVSLLSRILRRLYCIGYVGSALFACFFVPGNAARPSRHLPEGDPYERYLRLWSR